MKALEGVPFDAWRVRGEAVMRQYGGVGDATCGAFRVPCAGVPLFVIASQADGWDHVSVSIKTRCPDWSEMQFVKRAFFKPDEWVMELHPPLERNISLHNYCLHLWRPQEVAIPLPPPYMVA
jgi:hypothetical protein